MPGPTDQEMREYLDADDFGGLFRRLGWDNPIEGLAATVETEESVWAAEAAAFTGTDGESRRITPQEALHLARCGPEAQPAARLEDHHDMVAIALLVIDLHRDGRLCLPAPQSGVQTEPSIICSMGLRLRLAPGLG